MNKNKKNMRKQPKYITVEGLRFAANFCPEDIRSALSYQPRPYDVFVVTYPKCGTSWMMQIALLILHMGELPESMEEYFACTPFLEMLGSEAVEKMPRPSPIRSHLPFDMIPYSPSAKYIYVARNPEDCCVSFYHHTKLFPAYEFQKGSFDDFFELFIKGETDYNDYFDHLISWYDRRDQPNIFFITYEQLKDDTVGAIKQLADFLGPEYGKLIRENKSVMENILMYSSFDYMKKDTEKAWKEIVGSSPELASDMPAGLRSWQESVIDTHYSLPTVPLPKISVRDLMRRSSLIEWETILKPQQEERLQERIKMKTEESDVMSLWQTEV